MRFSKMGYRLACATALAVLVPGCEILDLSGLGVLPGGGPDLPSGPLTTVFAGTIVSTATGEPIPGVTVELEVPAINWTGTDATAANGSYFLEVTPQLSGDMCRGLVMTFTRAGYLSVRLVEPQTSCSPGYQWISPPMTPNP